MTRARAGGRRRDPAPLRVAARRGYAFVRLQALAAISGQVLSTTQSMVCDWSPPTFWQLLTH